MVLKMIYVIHRMDNINLIETEKIEEKIQILLRQTDYSPEVAREKLAEYGYNEEKVIRAYFGITENPKKKQLKSVNQEIYKQLRGHLDGAMKDYRDRADRGEARKL
jgi:hypothetical protein